MASYFYQALHVNVGLYLNFTLVLHILAFRSTLRCLMMIWPVSNLIKLFLSSYTTAKHSPISSNVSWKSNNIMPKYFVANINFHTAATLVRSTYTYEKHQFEKLQFVYFYPI